MANINELLNGHVVTLEVKSIDRLYLNGVTVSGWFSADANLAS